MNTLLRGVVRSVAESFELPGPVVEIGSFQVQEKGQEKNIDLRQFFGGKKYIGADMRIGPGVDLAADVERLPLADASVGTVIAISTFEHVPHFWRGFDEVRRVLKPNGAFLVACPFYFYIHNYPGDYWRFTPQAMDVLLHDYPQRILGWHGRAKRPLAVWALAFRGEAPPLAPQRFERYKSLLGEYGKQRLRKWRVARYRLASMFVGRAPFANYLDQGRWETHMHSGEGATAR